MYLYVYDVNSGKFEMFNDSGQVSKEGRQFSTYAETSEAFDDKINTLCGSIRREFWMFSEEPDKMPIFMMAVQNAIDQKYNSLQQQLYDLGKIYNRCSDTRAALSPFPQIKKKAEMSYSEVLNHFGYFNIIEYTNGVYEFMLLPSEKPGYVKSAILWTPDFKADEIKVSEFPLTDIIKDTGLYAKPISRSRNCGLWLEFDKRSGIVEIPGEKTRVEDALEGGIDGI